MIGMIYILKEAPEYRRTRNPRKELNTIYSVITTCQTQIALDGLDLIFPAVMRSSNKNKKSEHLLSYYYEPDRVCSTLTFKIIP
jgi:hypothetical protein